ncbi:MAG: hypothetical protein ABI537_03205 [Casimicrobiaceae bacterium]
MNIDTRFRRQLWAVAALAGLLLTMTLSAASAQEVLQGHVAGAVDYVSGGIGKNEAEAMKRASAEYALTVELSATEPAPTDGPPKSYYISGATLGIRDENGNSVLTTTTDGPFLLARLPDGIYTVDAEWNGVRKSATVTVDGQSRRHIIFNYAP